MDDKYFGFFEELLREFPTYIEEQDFAAEAEQTVWDHHDRSHQHPSVTMLF